MGENYDQLFGGDAIPLSSSYEQHSIATTVCTCDGSTIRVASWNLLAPCYKRGSGEAGGDNWQPRLQKQLAALGSIEPPADVIMLQEMWQQTDYLASWQQWASAHGYDMINASRTSSKRDGCCTLVRGLPVQASQTWSFADWGDRIVLGVNVTVREQPVWILNTHLTFSHPNEHDPVMRVHQARKLVTLMSSAPLEGVRILAGDLNGDIDDDAMRLLFDGSTGITPHTTEKGWVSHIAHTGAHLGCDFVAVATGTKSGMSTDATATIASHQLFGEFEHGLSDHLLLLTEIVMGPVARVGGNAALGSASAISSSIF
jgi:exonuclease III